MNINEFCDKAILVGIKNDPRGSIIAKQKIEKIKNVYANLPKREKPFFDKELLKNPYPDSRIVWGEKLKLKEIESIVCGIDIGPAEIVAVNALELDPSMILSHHPIGKASCAMWQVLEMQIGIYKKFGINVGAFSDFTEYCSIEAQYEDEKRLIREMFSEDNTERESSLAALFGYALVSMHTIADNCVSKYLQEMINDTKPRKVNGIINLLRTIPEYRRAEKDELIGPRVISGNKNNKTGKIMVDMTSGSESPVGVIPAISKAGIGTIVSMHVSSDWYEEAERHQINIVCAGHMSSDALGVNLLLDEILPYDVDVHCISGFVRYERK